MTKIKVQMRYTRAILYCHTLLSR